MALMFTLFVPFVQSFVLNDSKDSLKKKKKPTSLFRLHGKEWVGWVCV